MMRNLSLEYTLLLLVAAGCGDGANQSAVDDPGSIEGSGGAKGSEGNESEDESEGNQSEDEDESGGPKFDVGSETSGETGDGGTDDDCEVPEHVACDGSGDVANALGLNCPGELQFTVTQGPAQEGWGTASSFGTTNAFDPREGSEYVTIGSGHLSGLDPLGDCVGSDIPGAEVGHALPAPIVLMDIASGSCSDDASLIGTGDCSNTLQEEFSQTTAGAFDYTEIRIEATVPAGATSFSFDFAYLSREYPSFWESRYNDIFFGWLESETWTGNISFDAIGAAISVNAGFMNYLDADTGNKSSTGLSHPDCPTGTNCSAPELHETCLEGHGATAWLTTEAEVVPGENMVLVIAVMDLGDPYLDSYALLDNFAWGCTEGPPRTAPAG